jgi:purine-binding chemotaxis protein CheW
METAIEPSTTAREFLTFTLGAEEYGIDILKVQEIRGYDTVTRIANTPAYIRGVINLRGHIVPIIDLRVRFALGDAKYDAFTVVIILNIGKRIVGVVVDSVSDVMTLRADQIRPAPEFSSTLGTEYLLGLGTLEDRMIILVDIACLLESPDMGLTEPQAVAEAL